MGQTLRRAVGRARPASIQQHQQHQQLKNAERQVPAPLSAPSTGLPQHGVPNSDTLSRNKNDSGVLEERDPAFDAMLSKMVGRIRSKPGGKLERGEAFVVEKYNRALPKLRSSKPTAGHDEETLLPAGTLNVAQLRQIILLHQGKSEDHQGVMADEEIAKKFRIDVVQVRKILQFVSLPPEDSNKKSEQ